MDQLAPLPHSIDSGSAGGGARAVRAGKGKSRCFWHCHRSAMHHQPEPGNITISDISEMRNLPRLSCPSNATGVGNG